MEKELCCAHFAMRFLSHARQTNFALRFRHLMTKKRNRRTMPTNSSSRTFVVRLAWRHMAKIEIFVVTIPLGHTVNKPKKRKKSKCIPGPAMPPPHQGRRCHAPHLPRLWERRDGAVRDGAEGPDPLRHAFKRSSSPRCSRLEFKLAHTTTGSLARLRRPDGRGAQSKLALVHTTLGRISPHECATLGRSRLHRRRGEREGKENYQGREGELVTIVESHCGHFTSPRSRRGHAVGGNRARRWTATQQPPESPSSSEGGKWLKALPRRNVEKLAINATSAKPATTPF
jgi:hypothetical protein